MLTVFASQKGGSGKSTILCNLLPIFIHAGKRVALLDYDPQGTSFRWGSYRAENKSLPGVEYSLGGDLETALRENDHVFVDTPGHLSEDNIELMAQADLLIIPVKPSQADIDTLPRLNELIRKLREINPKIKVEYILNESPTTTKRERAEALNYLSAIGIEPIPTTIHSRKAYRDSIALGKSVSEMADPKAASEIDGVYRDIFC